ncbi:EamA-like transporter family [SAR116 cluster alpha proteobacterium HIMB100]|nr:EamA-like transporter family [SAR116 cluster alpha proteobacterium HIMB100]
MTAAFLTEKMKNRLAILMVFISPACFCSNMLLARAMAGTMPPVTMAVLRWGLVAVLLGVVLWPRIRAHLPALRAEAGQIIWLGGLGMGLCGAPIYLAGHYTTATNIGLIYSVCPLLILAFGFGLYRVAVRPAAMVGMVCGFLGVAVILIRGDISVLAGLAVNSGDLLVVVGTLAFAFYSLGLKYRPSALPPLLRFAACAAAGALWHLPFMVYELAVQTHTISFTADVLAAIAVLVFISSIGAYLSYGYIVARLGAARAGAVLYIVPVYNAGLAIALLGEVLSGYHLIGLSLILPGLWLANRG